MSDDQVNLKILIMIDHRSTGGLRVHAVGLGFDTLRETVPLVASQPQLCRYMCASLQLRADESQIQREFQEICQEYHSKRGEHGGRGRGGGVGRPDHSQQRYVSFEDACCWMVRMMCGGAIVSRRHGAVAGVARHM
jgi:hypothetical protein